MNNVRFEAADAIATVTIDRPKALNALNTETLHELNACFREIRERKDIRVVILTGGGEKSFVAGADIAEMYRSDAAAGQALGTAKAGDDAEAAPEGVGGAEHLRQDGPCLGVAVVVDGAGVGVLDLEFALAVLAGHAAERVEDVGGLEPGDDGGALPVFGHEAERRKAEDRGHMPRQ